MSNIGRKVKIINLGQKYSNYEEMFSLLGFKNKNNNNNNVYKTGLFEVFAEAIHPSSKSNMLAIRSLNHPEIEYLIDDSKKAIEYVTENIVHNLDYYIRTNPIVKADFEKAMTKVLKEYIKLQENGK